MRFICVLILLVVSIIEIGPIPMSPLFLMMVVVFRPLWFYRLVLRIYGRRPDRLG